MKKIQPVKLLIILLFLNNHILSFSQPDYFKTEFDSGKVIINTIIPNAASVKILGMGGSWGLYNLNKDFTKSGDSLWQVTLDPASISYITPGFHYYSFMVNGVYTANPNEKIYYGGSYWRSGFDIPDSNLDFYNIKDVPHGTIRKQLYYSSTTRTYRNCFIYLPPGYDTKSTESYPVLFLQHGMNENEYSWHMQGKVNFILDNLIAEQMALPMIVVMENGMSGNYSSLVLNDLIPLLKENYKVKTDRLSMAVAGLSMGANQATTLAFGHLGVFGYVGAFSGGSVSGTNNINDSIEVLYNGYGIADELNIGQSFEGNLRYLRINHVNAQFPGGHEWQVWRKCLYQFAQLLFKPYTYEHPYTGITDISQNTISVYPNPFTGQIHIQFDNVAEFLNAQYELHDISGKRILSFTGEKSDAETKISEALQSCTSALYILSVSNQNKICQVEIIK